MNSRTTENRDFGKRNSLVWSQHLVYMPARLLTCRAGNVLIFYIAGHEMRLLKPTLRLD